MASTTIVVGRVGPIRIHSVTSLGSLGPAVRLTAGPRNVFVSILRHCLKNGPDPKRNLLFGSRIFFRYYDAALAVLEVKDVLEVKGPGTK